jgi:hypothetical protein
MKKYIIKLLLVFSLISFIWVNYISNTYAEWASAKEWTIRTYISTDLSFFLKDSCWGEEWNYYCDVPKWISLITLFMWKIIKFFTYIAALGSVLFIIVNWILYSMWWAEPSMKDDAKKRITWTLAWLVLLLLSWVILNQIAPWIYKG